MAAKIIPFLKKNTSVTKSEKEDILEEGKIGNLSIKVFKRGTIHIVDEKKDLIFRKDPHEFEKEINEINTKNLSEYLIKGAGDTANLILKLKNGDLEISLEAKEHGIIKSLKSFIEKAKKAKGN